MRSDYYHDIDLHANQLLNIRLQNITSAGKTALGLTLGAGSKGYEVYDTDLLLPFLWDGTQWTAASGGSATWGYITGIITNQSDLINYLANNYYPLSSNPAGYLTSSAITGMVTGSGTLNYIPKWTPSGTVLGNSLLYDDGSHVGVGNITPQVLLHIGNGGGGMGFPYEEAVIERNGDVKFGVYTSVSAFGLGGAAIVLGATGIVNENNLYPGFEFQLNPTYFSNDTFVRYNFLERDATGTVTYSNPGIFNLYADSRISFRTLIGIGTQMVVADPSGFISRQAIPTGNITGTGVATRVAFWDSTTSLTSSPNLYWDNINNRLGIGTATPTHTLSVIGNGLFQSIDLLQGGTPFITFTSTDPLSNNTWTIGNQYDYGYLNISDSANSTNIPIRIAKISGNVIIGAANSSTITSYKLDVNGNQNISGYLNFKPSAAPTSIRIGSNDIENGGSSPTNDRLVLIGNYVATNLSAKTANEADSLIAIGYGAASSTTIGGIYSIYLGRNTGNGITTGSYNTHIGSSDVASIAAATSNTIHITAGSYEFNNASNAALNGLTTKYAYIGGGYSSATYINDFYLGAAPFVVTPSQANLNIYSPSGSGTNLVGSNFTINAGRGTGNGTPGDFTIKTSTALTSGSTLQTLTERFKIAGGNGAITASSLAGTGTRLLSTTSVGLITPDDLVTNFVKYGDILTEQNYAGRTLFVSPSTFNGALFSTAFGATTQAQWTITDTILAGVLNARTRRYQWKNRYNTVATFTGSTSGTTLTTVGSPALFAGCWIRLNDGSETGLGQVVSGSGNTWTLSISTTQASQSMKAIYGSRNVYSQGAMYFGFWSAGYPGSISATFKTEDPTTGTISTSAATTVGTNISVNPAGGASYWKVPVSPFNYITDIYVTFLDDGVHYINYQTHEMVVNYAQGIDVIPFINKDGGKMFGTLSFVNNPDGLAVSTKGSITNAGALTMATGTFTALPTSTTNTEMVSINSTTGVLSKQTIPSGSTSPLTTKGDLYTFSTVNARLGVGTNGQLLTADSTAVTGLKWVDGSVAYYGAFSDVTNQGATVVNTGYAMIFALNDITPNGVTMVANGGGTKTRITFANAGLYNLQWSAQFTSSDTAENDVSVWLRKNGTDVVGSRGLVSVPKKIGLINGHALPSWNFVVNASNGDYYEFVWSTSNTNVSIEALPATAYAPSTASTILTVTPVISGGTGGGTGGTGTLYKFSSTTYQSVSGTSTFVSAGISGASFTSGDLLKIDTVVATTTTSLATVGISYWINTSATITGAVQIANYNAAITNIYIPMNRVYWANGGTFYARNFTGSTANSQNAANSALSTTAIPSTFYIIVQIVTTGTDLAGLSSFVISKT